MSDGFDHDKVNLHQRGVVDQPDRLGHAGGGSAPGAPSGKRRAIVIALIVLLVGAFVALLATDDADAPAEPAAATSDG